MRPAAISFDRADQRRFAAFSGDSNPIHLDPVASRRTAVGEPIVHGMHLLLRALDHALHRRLLEPIRVAATFRHPVRLGEPLSIVSSGEGVTVVDSGGAPVAEIDVAQGVSWPNEPAAPRRRTARSRRTRPAALTVDDIESAQGRRTLAQARSSAAKLFPHATHALGQSAVAAFAGLSAIVGMDCPGRDSLLSSVRVDVMPHARSPELRWRVTRFDRRFGLVKLSVDGNGIRAEVTAFLRRAPAPRPTIAAAASRVHASEFAGQRALIVGGSRGLGAATAVLVAAGGGTPIVTYVAGSAEAAVLRREARAATRSLVTVRFDVTAQDMSAIAEHAARHRVTHLYYFATPRIFGRRHDQFDAERFQRFADMYVSRFARVCAAVRAQVDRLIVFYPSSTAIDEQPAELAEYAAAKSAGEYLCRILDARDRDLFISVKRLPRVDTDQTASTLNVAAADPLGVMLPIVREMQQALR